MLSHAIQRLTRPFYGWYIVVTGMLVTLAAGPGQSFMFTIFIDPIIQDTGYSRTVISTIYAVGTVLSALAVVVVSELSDRKGPRTLLIIVSAVFGLACVALSFAEGIIALAISLALVRALGQGAMPVNSSLLVSQWFILRRGRAMAILGLAGAMSVAVMPNLGQFLIDTLSWHGAYAVLGVMVWGLVLPISLYVVRDRPEDIGLYPDGAEELPEQEVRRARLARSRVRRSVLRSLDFWALAFPLSLPPLVDTALIFHQVALFQRQGLTAEVAARVFIPFAIASALMSLASGFIIERTGPTRLFIVNAGIFISAILFLQIATTPFMAGLYAVILGCALGMQQIGSRYTWPYYYGRHGLGHVQGSAMMVMIGATALGPVAFSTIAEGVSYQVAFVSMIGLLILAATMRGLYHIQPA